MDPRVREGDVGLGCWDSNGVILAPSTTSIRFATPANAWIHDAYAHRRCGDRRAAEAFARMTVLRVSQGRMLTVLGSDRGTLPLTKEMSMQSSASTVEAYLAELPDERRAIVAAVRDTVLANLDPAYAEGMGYGMIGWSVPHSVFPAGYHCNPKLPLPFASLASQKNHVSLYLMGLGEPESEDVVWFRQAWAASGKKKLDMGKACIKFKKLDDIALDVIGEAIKRMPAARYIALYQQTLAK